MNTTLQIILILGLSGLIACSKGFKDAENNDDPPPVGLPLPEINTSPKNFGSCAEVQDWAQTKLRQQSEVETVYRTWRTSHQLPLPVAEPMMDEAEGSSTDDTGITNLQEEGVDESDHIKVSEKAIFVVHSGSLSVVSRETRSLIQNIAVGDLTRSRLLIYENKLVVVGLDTDFQVVKVFDISVLEKDKPIPLIKEFQIAGRSLGERLINGRLVIATQSDLPFRYTYSGEEGNTADNFVMQDTKQTIQGIPCHQISRPIIDDFDFGMTTFFNLDLSEPQPEPLIRSFMGGGGLLYVSENNMYVVKEHLSWFYWDSRLDDPKTRDRYGLVIRKVESSTLSLKGVGLVPGSIRNSLSMKEYPQSQTLAVVTTTSTDRQSHLWVLGSGGETKKMEIVASVEGLAPLESVRAVRFVKDFAFVVTFRRIDPLFSIDLSDPYKPLLKGELKIPGFSTYLHSISDSRLLGVGYHADETTGRRQGLQLSLFDVVDISNVKVVEQTTMGTSALRLYDENNHHSKYINRSKSLLGFPVEFPSYDFTGNAIRNGALIYSFANDRFEYLAYLTHEDLSALECDKKSKEPGLWGEPRSRNSYAIDRLFDLDGYLVTVSPFGLKFHDPNDLEKAVSTVSFGALELSMEIQTRDDGDNNED